MDGDELKERQRLVNQLCLDHLLRGLGTTVLRRKFTEIYAKLHGGKEWTDGAECGQRFCRSKWGNPSYVNALQKQREMMQGGNIQLWDLHCLQSVITQMLTTALKDMKEENKSSSSSSSGWKKGPSGQPTPVNWDQSWGSQMYHIRTLANIRHSIAHMPNEALTQGEFEEKWGDAVVALKGLGTKQEEIDDILQISQTAFNFSTPAQQGQSQGQKQVTEENEAKSEERNKEVEELRAKIQELQLQNKNHDQVKGQDEVKDEVKGQGEVEDEVKGQGEVEDEVKGQGEVEDEVKGQDEVNGRLDNDNEKLVVLDKQTEKRAECLMKRGDLAASSEDWDKARNFYTRALEIPDISDDQLIKIHLNRSWAHLRILQMPEPPFDLNLLESEETESESGKKSKKSNEKGQSQSKASETQSRPELAEARWPKKLTSEQRKFHFIEGVTDADLALELLEEAGLNSSKASYRLAQYSQYRRDWNDTLEFYDQALDQSDLDDLQLRSDRNACQLELLNQIEVEEVDWIPGKKNQTMAGVHVRRNPQHWRKVMELARKVDDPGIQLQCQAIKAHFLAQGIPLGDEKGNENQKSHMKGQEVTVSQQTFDQVVQLYKEAWNGGLPTGLYNLGLLLQEGNGVTQDFTGAVRLFKMAASFPVNVDDTSNGKKRTPLYIKEGVYAARYRLGLCYEFGLGVARDDKKAVHCYEMASLGEHPKALRKLGDTYSKGLLGVPQDMDVACFCWEQAGNWRDMIARTSVALHLLQTDRTWPSIWYALSSFSDAIIRNPRDGTPAMLNTLLDRKRNFQGGLAKILLELSTQSDEYKEENEREPEAVSWNVSALVQHTLHTQELLEVAKNPEFQQKLLDLSTNWRSQTAFIFTNRLVKASNCCVEGLSALQELNQLYRQAVTEKDKDKGFCEPEDYPPDLQRIPGIDPALLTREGQLMTTILTSFGNSIRLVGAADFHDQVSLSLIQKLLTKVAEDNLIEKVTGQKARFRGKTELALYASLLMFYTYVLKEPGIDGEEGFAEIEQNSWKRGDPFIEPTIAGAAVLGSLGKFEEAVGDLKDALKKLNNPGPNSVLVSKSKCDLLFAQALCCKSAGLTRGVNSANRKKIKEAMSIFQKFLSLCPADAPTRSEAHYQLGLCTLYLENMRVKGQVKGHAPILSSAAQEILHNVLAHFTKGKVAEPDHFPGYNSPAKLLLIRKIRELETLVKTKNPAQASDFEKNQQNIQSSSLEGFGRFLDPFFKFPASSLPLRMNKETKRVIQQFRRFCWGARRRKFNLNESKQKPQHPLREFGLIAWRYNLQWSPFSGTSVYTQALFVGCYEIVEPVIHFHYRDETDPEEEKVPPKEQEQTEEHQHPKFNTVLGFTVVQDDSGAVFSLQFTWTYRGNGKDGWDDQLGRIGEFRRGARIIIYQPYIRLDEGGSTSLMVNDADAQIFHLPVPVRSVPKCGFCGAVGRNLQQKCPQCRAVSYCSQECQTADERELHHGFICDYVKLPTSPSKRKRRRKKKKICVKHKMFSLE